LKTKRDHGFSVHEKTDFACTPVLVFLPASDTPAEPKAPDCAFWPFDIGPDSLNLVKVFSIGILEPLGLGFHLAIISHANYWGKRPESICQMDSGIRLSNRFQVAALGSYNFL
jgi:hypothetical protein